MIFGHLLDAPQAEDSILLAFFVRHAGAITAERDDIGYFGFSSALDPLRNLGGEPVMALFAVPPVGNPGFSLSDGWHQAVLTDRGPLLRFDEIDPTDPHFRRLAAKIIERNLVKAPTGHGLLQAPRTGRRESPDCRGQCEARGCMERGSSSHVYMI